LSIFLPTIALADITLPSVIADQMVLQRDMVIPIWGRANAKQIVDVSIVDVNGNVINSVQAKSGDDGKFMARLPAMSACKNPLMMKVACAGESVQRSDVLVGEVWLWVVNQIWNGKFKKVLEAIRSIRHCLRRCNVSVLHRMSAYPEADLPKK
jgi:sialate O-acetylesterase